MRIPPDAATAKVFRWARCSHYWLRTFYTTDPDGVIATYAIQMHDTIHVDPTRPLSIALHTVKTGNGYAVLGNLLFQNLLLVHPVGDARDGVLVVASVRRHCRWMGTLFFLVTNSVHMHC